MRLSWDEVGAGRSPCTEPARKARSRLVRCKVCVAGASEMELGAKSNALAVNDGGTCIIGKEGINCVSFCGVINPKAASRGGSAAAATAGALTGVGPKTVPVDATDIDGTTLESGIDKVAAGTAAVAAKGACYEGGVKKKTGDGVQDGSDSMSDETSMTSPVRNPPAMGAHSDLIRPGWPSCSAKTAPGVSPSSPLSPSPPALPILPTSSSSSSLSYLASQSMSISGSVSPTSSSPVGSARGLPAWNPTWEGSVARPNLSKAPAGAMVITPRVLVNDALEGPMVSVMAEEGTVMECSNSAVKRNVRENSQ